MTGEMLVEKAEKLARKLQGEDKTTFIFIMNAFDKCAEILEKKEEQLKKISSYTEELLNDNKIYSEYGNNILEMCDIHEG